MIHLANTFFELELSQEPLADLEEGFSLHSTFLQLQYLPLYYASESDSVVVTQINPVLKTASMPKMVELQASSFPNGVLMPWGDSDSVAKWAFLKGITYTPPSSKAVLMANSKETSALAFPAFTTTALAINEFQLLEAMQNKPMPLVIKTCYGFSGRGNLVVTETSMRHTMRALSFAEPEWKKSRPVIVEPWVERVQDFSSQWEITSQKQINYLGSVLFHANLQGSYTSTIVGREESLFADIQHFFKQHIAQAQLAVEYVASQGYYGYVGIDAMLYKSAKSGSIQLVPVLEINARKTMSQAAIAICSKMFDGKTIKMSYIRPQIRADGLLPASLVYRGKHIIFEKQLYIDPMN